MRREENSGTAQKTVPTEQSRRRPPVVRLSRKSSLALNFEGHSVPRVPEGTFEFGEQKYATTALTTQRSA